MKRYGSLVSRFAIATLLMATMCSPWKTPTDSEEDLSNLNNLERVQRLLNNLDALDGQAGDGTNVTKLPAVEFHKAARKFLIREDSVRDVLPLLVSYVPQDHRKHALDLLFSGLQETSSESLNNELRTILEKFETKNLKDLESASYELSKFFESHGAGYLDDFISVLDEAKQLADKDSTVANVHYFDFDADMYRTPTRAKRIQSLSNWFRGEDADRAVAFLNSLKSENLTIKQALQNLTFMIDYFPKEIAKSVNGIEQKTAVLNSGAQFNKLKQLSLYSEAREADSVHMFFSENGIQNPDKRLFGMMFAIANPDMTQSLIERFASSDIPEQLKDQSMSKTIDEFLKYLESTQRSVSERQLKKQKQKGSSNKNQGSGYLQNEKYNNAMHNRSLAANVNRNQGFVRLPRNNLIAKPRPAL